jgi:beta-glucan synthesis-associated protein KRE6
MARDSHRSCEFVSTISEVVRLKMFRFGMPQMIDPHTPDSAKTRTGFDGEDYELVFSDEFEMDGRTFYPGDDPYWEAVDLWYGSTADLEWYDPAQITTKNGQLVITMDQVADMTLNHGLPYKSGMLQSWNKFCFSSGYIEVSITLPGPNSQTQGYVSLQAPVVLRL